MLKLLEMLKIKLDAGTGDAKQLTLADGKTPVRIDGDLQKGVVAYYTNSEGVEKPFPEGNFPLSTGDIITTDKDGVIQNVQTNAVNNPSPDNPTNPKTGIGSITSGLP